MQADYVNLKLQKVSGHYLFFFLILSILFASPTLLSAQDTSVDKFVELQAVAGLRFDKVRFTVKPGSLVRITLKNSDEMMHNLLVVKPDTRVKVVKKAEAMGKQGVEKNFIPESENILAYIPLLDPGEENDIIFTVPEKEAVYPYVCTYPAHGVVMYGAIYATNNPDDLPPIDEDLNIPEPVRNQIAASNAMHPYGTEMPTMNRLFMPESSPASIAVGMEKGQSYNWDAGYSFLRYAWDGGYIDASEQWEAKAHEVAEIEGNIYYRNTTGFPFRIGRQDSIPKPEFKGYRLIDGYPQFMYKMGNILVYELIVPAGSTSGFEIKYMLENVNQPIWYVLSNNDVQVRVSKGTIKENMVKLTAKQATEFSISILSEEQSEL